MAAAVVVVAILAAVDRHENLLLARKYVSRVSDCTDRP
jgi:hypothetical protein